MEQINNTRVPEVSIITITKNRAELLKRAINSVLNQTFKNYEYIIIDGASTDNTSQVVNSYGDSRIVYEKLEKDMDPIVLCMDYAVSISRGKYITFLDDDDEYLPQKIEKQYNLIESLSPDYGCVYCWMDYYDARSGVFLREHHPTVRGNVFYDSLEEQAIGGTPTLFMRREVYLDVNGWNKELKVITDWEFNTRIAKKYLIDFVPEVMVKVYINHEYDNFNLKQSNMNYRNNVINHIQLHEYYLQEFRDGFQKIPEKKITHLIVLTKCYARIRNYNGFWKTLHELITEFGFSSVMFITILKSAYFFIKGSK
jgi:glycosyltransferase involved in cell wall biosynthesis